MKAKEVQSKFWRDIAITWLDFDKSPHLMDFESEEHKIRNQPLYYNNGVRFKNKALLIKKWIEGGMHGKELTMLDTKSEIILDYVLTVYERIPY